MNGSEQGTDAQALNVRGPSETEAAAPEVGAPSTAAILQRNIKILLALNTVSVAVAVLLFVGLFFSWSATSELSRIRQQIDGLQQFETRISGNMDLMNSGIQNRLSRLDQRISQIQSGVRLIQSDVGTEVQVDRLKTVVDSNIDFFHPATAQMMFSPELAANGASRFELARAAPTPRVTVSRQPVPQAQGASLFRRIVTPDGKVRYEKRSSAAE